MLPRIAALVGAAVLLWGSASQAAPTSPAEGCGTPASEPALKAELPINRFSAAELLNSCLPRMAQPDAELAPLIQTLSGELTRLEANVAELEATRFSPTTTLKGLATLVLGGNNFSGSDRATVTSSRAQFGATTFNYDLKLILDTSFTGEDLLRVRLRAGDFDRVSNSFYSAGPSTLSALETAFQEKSGPNILAVNRLYYLFPLGHGFTAGVGPRITQLDLLALDPSVYPAETVLDWFTLYGAPAAYNDNLGTGAGLWWQSPGGFSISANYVAGSGNNGNPNEGGIGTADSASTGSLQLGYQAEQWAVAALLNTSQNGAGVIPYATDFTLYSLNNPGHTLAFALSGYWQPRNSGWLPAISGGWGFNRTIYDAGVQSRGLVANSQSWSIGLQWSDAFAPGNVLGMAVGQPTFATTLYGGETPRDGNLSWEWWYKLQLSDNLALTPALFLLSRPLGGYTPAGESFRQIGALLKTTLRF